MAFPIPYRASINQYSRAQGLDPFLVSALIRQESEFNPQAISPANAYGLMQVLPSTGRQLARQLRIRRFSSSSLLTPDRNIQLGTKYFRWLIDVCNGHEECALAAFNAGKSRTDLWQTWGTFSEPAEFIETIPFGETRGYVQHVLENAVVYDLINPDRANMPKTNRLSAYLGKSAAFDEAIGAFATAYAKQTERDHEALLKALKNGRLPSSGAS